MLQTLARRTEFLTVLRNRNYRFYYAGMLSSVTGQQMYHATQLWLVYYLTGSPATLGWVAGVQAIPGLVLMLFFSALADRVNPKKIIIVGEAAAALFMVVLATLIVTGLVQVWHIVVIAFLTSLANSVDHPARRVVWAHLVPREQFIYAISLNQTIWNGTRIFAPGLAGLIVATVASTTGDEQLGLGVSHYVSFLGFLAMAVAIGMIRLPQITRSTGATVLHDIVEGLAYVRRNSVFIHLMGLYFVAGFFGHGYTVLMPLFAGEYLGVGVGEFGVLLSVTGAGGIVGTFGVASFGRYQNRPWLILGGNVLAGVGLVLFATTSALLHSYPLALVLLFLIGATSSVFMMAAGTVINLLVQDEYRGRVMGLRGLMWSLIPLGGLQAGLLASVIGAPLTIVLNGVVVIAFTLLAYVFSREIRNLRQLAPEATRAGPTPERADG